MLKTIDQSNDRSLLLNFTIDRHEGTGEFDGQSFKTWKDVQYAFNTIFNDAYPDGYNKVFVSVLWNNGMTFSGRIDVGSNDYCPKNEPIGMYLYRLVSRRQMIELVQQASFTDEGMLLGGGKKQVIEIELSSYCVNEAGQLIKFSNR